jgi:NAD(P)-dependent dehydrogenase (short-subunit alcohol dehydrogenase family)
VGGAVGDATAHHRRDEAKGIVVVDPRTALLLEGKAAIVTGGGSGLGRIIANAFCSAGASVCLVGRRPGIITAALEELHRDGYDAVGVRGSITDEAIREACVTSCLETFGRCDIVVNNAGVYGHVGPSAEGGLDGLSSAWDINVDAPLQLITAVYRAWMRQHGGVVINMVSIGGLKAQRKYGAYGVTKAALVQLTRQLALELAPDVRVNAIAPGLIATGMAEAHLEGRDEAREAAKYPLQRFGAPDDIAAAALFLASAASAWVTGQVLAVDGGALLK